MRLSEEQMAALNDCNDTQELVARLAEMGVAVSMDEAEKLKEMNEFTSLSEDELEGLSGGCGTSEPDHGTYSPYRRCPSCYTPDNSSKLGTGEYVAYYHCNTCNIDWYCSR